MIREYDKCTHIYTKYKNELINNTMSNKYLSDLFDYYLRYLNFFPDINNLNYNENDIKIAPELENSFKTFIQKRDNLVKNKISLTNSAPYYEEFIKAGLNADDRDEAFMNAEYKILKNTYIDYSLFYDFKSTYFEPQFNQDDITGNIKIKDVWEF